jgi:ribosomal protein S18 acetylase RimI-like enzyme
MELTITRTRPDEAEQLVAAQVAAFHHDSVLYPGLEPDGPPGYDSVPHLLEAIEEATCYTIADGGRPIGVIILVDHGDDHVHLDVIAIDPAYHNRGVGTRAMRFIEQAHPARRWTLHTPSYALRNQHFYEKLGFVKTGEEVSPAITLFAYERRSG